ncbi:hypothetical protein CC86DRAFT_409720 [Ophiobolus disseminans]|uniref:BTB domain-containing protein n=1 Tax=Ophiobolus disseminans TaxID=1469910 RepID=A0A6A6ZQ74_9PLEO|nr:hypothetical protein CC86DRAFT_409720 [Ophiobolus disseminans]
MPGAHVMKIFTLGVAALAGLSIARQDPETKAEGVMSRTHTEIDAPTAYPLRPRKKAEECIHFSFVCSQCNFFDAASRFGKEAEEGKIDLADDEPEIVKYMIQYLYELDYHIPSELIEGPWAFQLDWETQTSPTPTIFKLVLKNREHMVFLKEATEMWKNEHANNTTQNLPLLVHADDLSIHADVYALAEKYNVSGLKDLTYEKFEAGLNTPQQDTRLKRLVAAYLVREKHHYGMYFALKEALEARLELAYHMLLYEWSIELPLENPSNTTIAT